MMTTTEFSEIQIYRFRRYENAESFANHAVKPMMIVLGDDQYFWVVRMSDAQRLVRAGYELAPKS